MATLAIIPILLTGSSPAPKSQSIGIVGCAPTFKNVKLVPDGSDETTQVDVTVLFADDGIWLARPKTVVTRSDCRTEADPFWVTPYSAVTGVEYFATDSKSQWLNITTADGHTLLRLDNSIYKLVIAELEKRTHLNATLGMAPACAPAFKNAKLVTRRADKTVEADATILFSGDGIWIARPRTVVTTQPHCRTEADPFLVIPYGVVTSAEYSVNNSRSHWLNVKTRNDYTLLRLDNSNYKLVITELEKRTNLTVTRIGADK